MSKIEVDNVVPQSGTNINLGESGDTVTVPAGVTLDTTNSTVTLPDGSVTNAKLQNSSISINGSSVSLGGSTTIETGISWQSTIVTGTTLSAVAGNGYWIDTTSNACTVTLPASASVGDQIILVDYARTWGTNSLTINLNGLNYQGGTTNPVYNTSGQSVTIIYSGSTKGWIPISDDDVANEGDPQPYSVEYLVVAGGASGASVDAGGGGAGGFLTNYGSSPITFNPGTVYTITIGAGGATQTTNGANGNDGNDSVLSGTGISTVTAFGGGSGASGSAGVAGGSGGGAGSYSSSGGAGTVGQGNNGGAGSASPPSYGGGGGGGAGAVGGNGSSSAGGAGGDGLSNAITGSAIYYAGGGGGFANDADANAGAGGNGGGGRGADDGTSIPVGSGTANTGGGGGGTAYTNSGAGGSGVVILRFPTESYSGITTGSPTVTTDSTDTIIKFTGSGTYTG